MMQANTKDKEQQSANTSSKGIYNNSVKRNEPMILFDKVCKRYQNGVEAIKNLSFRIEEGEFVFLMGSSGAGKSTLIKLILMEERADDGRILVNSCNLENLHKRYIQKYRRSIGVFFQDFRLLEKKTVFQNVAFAMEITGASRKEIKEKVDITLSIMGLSAKRNELPSHLSGGEQQRVALARAIVNGPDILIADEPTGNLDPENSQQIMTLLKMINARGTTVLVATHEQNLADESGLRIIRLDHGENISKDTANEKPKERHLPENKKHESRRMEDLFVEPTEKKQDRNLEAENRVQRIKNRLAKLENTAPKGSGPKVIEIKTETNAENTAPSDDSKDKEAMPCGAQDDSVKIVDSPAIEEKADNVSAANMDNSDNQKPVDDLNTHEAHNSEEEDGKNA